MRRITRKSPFKFQLAGHVRPWPLLMTCQTSTVLMLCGPVLDMVSFFSGAVLVTWRSLVRNIHDADRSAQKKKRIGVDI